VVAIGTGATALALGLNTGPTPPPEPLAEALHKALTAPQVEGVSARIEFTNHLLEGANLSSGGGGEASQLSSSPLISGASGRLWIGTEGHARLELQSEKGDTQILYDGHAVSMYDASSNTLYRYTVPEHEQAASADNVSGAIHYFGRASTPAEKKTLEHQITGLHARARSDRHTDSLGVAQPEIQHQQTHEPPTVAKIEESLAQAGKHANISPATPADVAGQAAYTVRVSPRENGGLVAGAELSWDAAHGVPLRAALYSTTSSSPVIELATTEISYGPVATSTLDFTPPADAKVKEVRLPAKHDSGARDSSGSSEKPKVSTHGEGLSAIALLESPVKAGSKEEPVSELESLPKVSINDTIASELPTPLGTILTFERAGVRYVLAGSVTPASIEAFARGL
jgi:outer membrane lipoprotein-sorting protein